MQTLVEADLMLLEEDLHLVDQIEHKNTSLENDT